MILKRQLVFLSLLFVVSVGYFISALNLGEPIAESGLTPSFFPLLLGGAAIVFSSTLLFQEIRSEMEEKGTSEANNLSHFWVIIAIFAYVLAFQALGYFISSGLFVFSIIIIFSSWEKVIQKAAISATIVVLGYVMFEQLFGVRLPALWG